MIVFKMKAAFKAHEIKTLNWTAMIFTSTVNQTKNLSRVNRQSWISQDSYICVYTPSIDMYNLNKCTLYCRLEIFSRFAYFIALF